jgi:vitamin B12 transporter
MRRHLLLTSALALSLAAPAFAQEVLPETVVTATRIPTPAERVPAAITVLTRADIEERGYQTLTEALRAVPGVRVAQEGGPGQRASAFVRGANSNHVLVLLDGVPVNDPSEPNGAFNFGNELLGEIERIEVVRGPASSLYGSGALGGVVNLVTRRAPEGRSFVPFGEVAAGTQRTVRGTAGFAGQSGAVDYLFSAQSLSTRGFDVTAPRLAGNTGERDGLRAAAATARFGVRLDAGTRVEALLRWRENTFGLDDIPAEDPNLEGNDRRWFGQIRGETALLGGAWVTGLRLARTEDRRVYRNEPDAANPDGSRDIYRGERVTLDWSNRVRLGDLGPLRDTALAFGLTRTEDRLESDTASFGTPFSIRAGTSSIAAHAGVQSRIASRLDVALGLRHDEPEDYAGFTSWRAGGVYALPEIASRLRVSAGTAFRAPSLEQRFGSAFARGNPELRPERSLGWEVGIETDVPGFGRDDLATVSATWFENRFRNLMVYDFAGRIVRNVDRAKVEGAELGLTLRPAAWLEADATGRSPTQ